MVIFFIGYWILSSIYLKSELGWCIVKWNLLENGVIVLCRFIKLYLFIFIQIRLKLITQLAAPTSLYDVSFGTTTLSKRWYQQNNGINSLSFFRINDNINNKFASTKMFATNLLLHLKHRTYWNWYHHETFFVRII